MTPEARDALLLAVEHIERELICCPVDRAEDVPKGHEICRWAIASRQIIFGVINGERT